MVIHGQCWLSVAGYFCSTEGSIRNRERRMITSNACFDLPVLATYRMRFQCAVLQWSSVILEGDWIVFPLQHSTRQRYIDYQSILYWSISYHWYHQWVSFHASSYFANANVTITHTKPFVWLLGFTSYVKQVKWFQPLPINWQTDPYPLPHVCGLHS